MRKVLVSLPDDLVTRMRTVVPDRMRSKLISQLLEKEIGKKERELYDIAMAVEKNETLHREMSEWDVTLNDGLDNDESW